MLVGIWEVCSFFFFPLRGISPRFQRVARWGVARPAFRRTANDLPLSCVGATRIHSLISGGCTGEIAPMEKRIDMHVDLLRREEFRGVECVSDVAKSAVPFIRGEDLNYNPIGPARNFITSARPYRVLLRSWREGIGARVVV